MGKAELQKGKIDSAISILSKAAKILGTAPCSCDCHFNLGKALCAKAKQDKSPDSSKSEFLSAKKELRTAIRVGRGNVISKQANDFLMANLPKELISPKTGEGTEMIAARLGLRSGERGVGGEPPKAKVYEFYAAWCAPCQQLSKDLNKIKQQYGTQVEFQTIDVDDTNNADIVEQFDVSPIPTVIYMNQDGQVVGYSIGYSGEESIQKNLQKILPNKS
jgi:thiol-disulfide isomerase/thioredoxin